MPSSPLSYLRRFFTWLRQTFDMLCERPDHLQRLAMIGAGVAVYPLVLGLIFVVWRGFAPTPENQMQALSIMGFALYGAMGLFALVVVSLLGTIKGLKLSGPGGAGVEITTTMDDPDIDATTDRTVAVNVHERRGPPGRPGPAGGKAPGRVEC